MRLLTFGRVSTKETTHKQVIDRAPDVMSGALFNKERSKTMEEKKKTTRKKTRPGKEEALAHIERIRKYGAPYYKKIDMLKILRSFVDLYWR